MIGRVRRWCVAESWAVVRDIRFGQARLSFRESLRLDPRRLIVGKPLTGIFSTNLLFVSRGGMLSAGTPSVRPSVRGSEDFGFPRMVVNAFTVCLIGWSGRLLAPSGLGLSAHVGRPAMRVVQRCGSGDHGGKFLGDREHRFEASWVAAGLVKAACLRVRK